jgi:transposase InsO family protein
VHLEETPTRNPGRPSHPQAQEEQVREAVRGYRETGSKTAGEATLKQAIPWAPIRLIRKVLKEQKAAWRAHSRAGERERRITVLVMNRDVLWCLDATHLGRMARRSIEGQVLRDAASRRTLIVTVGEVATTEEVVALLVEMETRGRLPLVLSTDNGPAYVAMEVERWLKRHHVIHLKNLPRTPRHNAVAERAIGELKAESGLGSGERFTDLEEPRRRIEDARTRLDEHRARPTLGWKTAAVVDNAPSPVYTSSQRRAFFEQTRAAMKDAAGGPGTARERRLAEREAVFQSLERRGLIQRTRGGLPFPSTKPDILS